MLALYAQWSTLTFSLVTLEVLVAGEPDDYFAFYEKVCAEWECIHMVVRISSHYPYHSHILSLLNFRKR